MSDRHLPVRPNLEQLKHQAKDLLAAVRAGDPAAIADFQQHLPTKFASAAANNWASAKLSDAQTVLARSYAVASWPRIVLACKITDAIWRDDADAVRQLVLKHPRLLHESALGREKSNWGAPMSYAANLGHDAIIAMLRGLGATDVAHALSRAVLQGQVGTARKLHAMLGGAPLDPDILKSPAYTLSVQGTAVLFELGATVVDADGRRLAPVDWVLETDSRNPSALHQILEMYVQHGLVLPDTPTMALFRGRIDLLEKHLQRDPGLLQRQFSFEEIYPPEFGCHNEVMATHGTPLQGATLLHIAVDYDEFETAQWLLAQGMNVDAKAAVDADGFGGHTALFATVVSQPNFWMNHNHKPQVAPLMQLLLEHGADPNARASLRKQIHPGYGLGDTVHEYRDVTPLSWGQRFSFKKLVSVPAMELIAAKGGHA